MPLQQFRNLAQAATSAKQTLNLLFGSFRSMRMTGHSWGCFGMGSIILAKCSHLGFALPRTFLISCQMPLSGFYLTDVPSPLFATFIVEPPCHTPPLNSLCQASLSSMILTFKNLNIPISAAKTEGPSQIIQFMSIILDSGKMEGRLPEDKVERIKSALSTFQSQRSTTLQELQSLIGTLNFACKVIPPGRSFLQRIIHLTRKVKKPHHHIKLTTGFYKDIEMWTIPFSSMGNLWHPLLVYRCLRLSGLCGNFPKKVVSGKVAAMSTTRPARHQHSLARTICN